MGTKSVRAIETQEGAIFFQTAVGCCAMVWGPRGIQTVRLPEANERKTRAHLFQDHPQARESEPTDGIRQAVEAIVGLLEGEYSDLRSIALDFDGVPPFHRKVYEATREILPGQTRTYGELAARVGSPGAARAVGQAMGRNPFVLVVPCHRVLGSSGKLCGFTAHGGLKTKRRLLEIEAACARGPEGSPGDAPGFGADHREAWRGPTTSFSTGWRSESR